MQHTSMALGANLISPSSSCLASSATAEAQQTLVPLTEVKSSFEPIPVTLRCLPTENSRRRVCDDIVLNVCHLSHLCFEGSFVFSFSVWNSLFRKCFSNLVPSELFSSLVEKFFLVISGALTFFTAVTIEWGMKTVQTKPHQAFNFNNEINHRFLRLLTAGGQRDVLCGSGCECLCRFSWSR